MKQGAIGRKIDYNDAYQKEHIKRIVVKLNDVTDSELIDHLKKVNKEEKTQTYIKRLIREDMNK